MMKKKLSPLWTFLIGLVLSVVALGVTLMLQTGSLMDTLGYNYRAPVLLLLNWLPMALLMILGYCVLGNVFYSGSLTVLIWGALSYVNLMKTDARGDPFVPGDIMLLFEGIEALGSYQLQLHPGKLAILLGTVTVLFLLGRMLQSPKPGLWKRIGIGAVAVGIFLCALLGPYASKTLYETIPGPDRSNVPRVFDCFGFPYVFLHNFNLYPVDKPEGYSRTEAEGYEEIYLQEQVCPAKAPNILMIMCEAFTDLPNEPVFTYSEEENPLAFFNAFSAREDVIRGDLIISNIGAGTANTEFDVLTGMMTNRIGEGTTSAFRVVHRNTDSIPRALSQVGYETFFIHPGNNWFYNRESVYNYLGISDHVFKDAFGPETYKGNWISDDGFLEILTENLERRDGDAPLFAYGVTIQNHQAYTQEKYGFMPEPVRTDLPLSEQAGEYLSVYFEGLRDSDRMLENLVSWLDGQEEPWVLAFFGDHQPNLGADFLSYRELGLYPENLDTARNRLTQYTVPYVIWGNQAYQKENDLPELSQTTISSHYLGALTCEAAGFQGLDGYFDYLNMLRQELPVCSTSGYMTADGTYLEQLPEELARKEELRWHWQYYRLKHQTIE